MQRLTSKLGQLFPVLPVLDGECSRENGRWQLAISARHPMARRGGPETTVNGQPGIDQGLRTGHIDSARRTATISRSIDPLKMNRITWSRIAIRIRSCLRPVDEVGRYPPAQLLNERVSRRAQWIIHARSCGTGSAVDPGAAFVPGAAIANQTRRTRSWIASLRDGGWYR
jgi:hypothetical protein